MCRPPSMLKRAWRGIAPEDVTPEQFDRLFAVNAKAPFLLVQRALALLPEGGRIVNISSGTARVAVLQQVVYARSERSRPRC
jgi:bifunctional oxygenase/reductase